MSIEKLYLSLKIFFKAKWSIFPPKKVDIILFDGIFNPFNKFLDKKSYSVFYTRNERLNLFILFICALKLNISKKQYIKTYFKYSDPKIVLTAIDNSHIFLEIKDYIDRKIKTISIQNAHRTYWGDLLSLEKKFKLRKKKFKIDLMFVFNKEIKKTYNKFITGKKIIIGSYTNNDRKKIKQNKKKEVIFISTHKPLLNPDRCEEKISNFDFFKNDKQVLKSVLKLCKKNNLKLNILGRAKPKKEFKVFEKEYDYFKKILGKNFKLISNQDGNNNYFILDEFKYTVTIDSTLGIENLSRGGRTIFIGSRPKKFPANTRAYGNMAGFKLNGKYWCYYSPEKNVIKVFNNLIKKDNKFWNNCIKTNRNSLIYYDPGNTIFNIELEKYLN